MASYAVIKQLSDGAKFSDIPWAAMKYDGKSMLLIGDDEFMDDWYDYFADKEGDWWNTDRFEDAPFSKFASGESGWNTYVDPDGEEQFLVAMSRLGGKKMKTIEYPGA